MSRDGAGVAARVAGRYAIGQSLGIGGMGRVWLARDEVLGRDVAIKEIALPLWFAHNGCEELRLRSLREARAAARINHPNVVKIYDVVHEDRPWIVMEYVPSRSLLQMIKEDGPLPVVHVALIGLAILSALEAAREAGVLHRDVKPSNVLVADDGRVVLTDFGSAVIADSDGVITCPGVVMGSPQYVSPERASDGVSSPEADLWSLGATLYAAVEGHAPYTRMTTMATLEALATQDPDPIHRAGPLTPVLEGLLVRDPARRMTAEHAGFRLLEIVEEFVGEPPADTTSALDELVVAGSPPALGRRPGRFRLAAAGVGIIALLGLAAGAQPASVAGARPASVAGVPAQRVSGEAAAAPAAGPATAGPATARPAVDAPPAGYQWWQHPTGFRVAIPARWAMVRNGGSEIVFRDPTGSSTLRVQPVADADPLVALAREEDRTRLVGYTRLRLESLAAIAEREYSYRGVHVRMHGIDRVFSSRGGTYLIQWRTPEPTWSANVGRLGVIVGSFRPPRRPPTGLA